MSAEAALKLRNLYLVGTSVVKASSLEEDRSVKGSTAHFKGDAEDLELISSSFSSSFDTKNP